ncbi:hypothetical protein Tco_0370728 [Tanacetum coccineum]
MCFVREGWTGLQEMAMAAYESQYIDSPRDPNLKRVSSNPVVHQILESHIMVYLRVRSIEPLENPLDTKKLESSLYHALGACRPLRNAVLTSIWYTGNDLCAAYTTNNQTVSNPSNWWQMSSSKSFLPFESDRTDVISRHMRQFVKVNMNGFNYHSCSLVIYSPQQEYSSLFRQRRSVMVFEQLTFGVQYLLEQRNLEDKILVPVPDSSQRPLKIEKICLDCGDPVHGLYCRQCALIRKTLEEVFQDFQDTSESSDDDTNFVNQEPFVVKQGPGVNSSQSPLQINHNCCYGCGDSLDDIFCQRCTCESCGKGAHYGYNCPPQVPIISKPEPCNNQTVNEFLQTLPSVSP